MSANIEESLCARCVHFRRLVIQEMRNTFSLKCEAQGKYIKKPRRSCGFYEPETWEIFLNTEEGEDNEN